MRLFILFFVVLLCNQVNGTIYQCDTTAPCGCSTASTVLTRIVGGENAAQGSWSWAISLRYYGSHFCGGSILSPWFIVTAAHCVKGITNLSPLSILAGSTTVTPSSSNPFYQIRSIAQIYQHAQYDPILLTNDIALLGLSTPLDMTGGKIKPICLPNGTVAQPPDNINMTAVGWGVTSYSSNTISPNLLQVTVQSISSTVKVCQSSLSDSRFQFCAGLLDGGKDTCSGDSGGPLMTFIDGLWQLHGLTSYGYKCALAGYPGIYTRVSSYVSWIKSITGDLTTMTTMKQPTTINTTTTTKNPTTTTTTTTNKIVITTTTKKPTTTITKKLSLTTKAYRQTTLQRLSLNFSSNMTSNDNNGSASQDLFEESLLQTTNSAKHSTIQSLFVIYFLPIIASAYSFILLFLL